MLSVLSKNVVRYPKNELLIKDNTHLTTLLKCSSKFEIANAAV